MKKTPLWALSVTTTAEAEDAISELLAAFTGQPVSSYRDVETGGVTVTVYSAVRPDKPAVETRIRQGLLNLRKCGIKVGSGRISLRKLRHQDWAESWKRHFKPIEIGSALLIRPSWSKRRPVKGQSLMVLDPGLSFGTGQHPTTSFCLEQLTAHRGTGKSFLDIGTGSGILAIAAAKLGFAPVEAFDFDRDAVRIAIANARKNRVLPGVRLYSADLTRLPARSLKKHDVICANLISTLLISEAGRILARLKPGGLLIVAGILQREFISVRRTFEKLGLRQIAARSEKEWRSGTFSRGPR